jgi:2-aminoadipate transaminase
LRLEVNPQLVAHFFRAPFPHPLEARLGGPQPGVDAVGVNLEMKLDAPRVWPHAKGLHRNVIAGREQLRTGRKLEGVLVPLKDPITGLKRADQCILLPRVGDPDRLEAQLANRCAVDAGIERAGQDLRAKADTEHRQAGVDRPSHQLSLSQQVGIPIRFIDIHLAAEHDQPADFVEFRPSGNGLEGVKLGNGQPLLTEDGGRDAERIVAVVTQAQHRVHAPRRMIDVDMPEPALPITQFIDRSGIIDLAWGHPDPDLLPVEALRQAAGRVFDRYGPDALNYGYAAGPGPLIASVCERLAEVDARAPAADSVVISAGASHAIDQVATLMTNPGDVVLVEDPTYHLAVRILRDHPLELVPIPTDAGGLQLDALEEIVGRLRQHRRAVRLLYTVPTFHNPTGISLAPDRRHRLVRFAETAGLLIVEDDAYRELSYDGPAPPSLWSLARPGTVLRLGSFAKSLAPGLRTGFITADAPLAGRIRDSGVLDSGGAISHFSSLVVAEFMAGGDYARNVEHLRNSYRQRRDALLSALTEHLDDRAGWQRPAGGYFVWLALSPGQDAVSYLPAAEAQGTSYMPGSTFSLATTQRGDSLRLAFSRYPPDLLAEAIRRLARALRG